MEGDCAGTESTKPRVRDDALQTLAAAFTHLDAARVGLCRLAKRALANRLHTHIIALSLHLEQETACVERQCCLDDDSVSQAELGEATWTEELSVATALATESAIGQVCPEDVELLQQDCEMMLAAAGSPKVGSVERHIGTSHRRSWIWSCSCQ